MRVIKNMVCDILEISENQQPCISMETDLCTIGLDSLKLIRLIVQIEDFYNVDLPDEYLFIENMDTLEKIVHTVNLIINK